MPHDAGDPQKILLIVEGLSAFQQVTALQIGGLGGIVPGHLAGEHLCSVTQRDQGHAFVGGAGLRHVPAAAVGAGQPVTGVQFHLQTVLTGDQDGVGFPIPLHRALHGLEKVPDGYAGHATEQAGVVGQFQFFAVEAYLHGIGIGEGRNRQFLRRFPVFVAGAEQAVVVFGEQAILQRRSLHRQDRLRHRIGQVAFRFGTGGQSGDRQGGHHKTHGGSNQTLISSLQNTHIL